MGLFSKRKPIVPNYDTIINNYTPQELESWFHEQKKKGVKFDNLTFKKIKEKISLKYEDEILKEMESVPPNEVMDWINSLKRRGISISDKAFNAAFEKSKTIQPVEENQLEVDKSKLMQEMLTEEIYNKCSKKDEDEIEEIREEDDELMDELEGLIDKGLMKDDEDVLDWLKEVKADKIYTIKYLRKRAENRMVGEGIFLF